ncbi:integral membrane protein MviN [Acidisarcina polymorpha]|uniref:Integral membrane protein MviN n=1 Tax=Acidisarcina polymorpha TaxID=2211140 RepID=A0A2Z5G186_9BACT|nr:murein biosynthesis integral membrane protein MurJ [Acidisarcina polymorpha]AXC12829.1 integral membrane protein MviN [Acidisarcina polymorpha]
MAEDPSAASSSSWSGVLRVFRPSHKHTAFTATLLLMLSAFLSRIIGLVRVKYIAYLFGAGSQTDAFNSAFQLPDMLAYFLVGGAASVTFVTMLSRYRETGREEDGTRAMSVILTSMLLVLGGAILLAELLAPVYVRWWFKGFTPEQAALCTSMTRILLPGQLLFFAGGVFGSVLLVRKQFALQAITPLVYNLGIIFGGVLLARTVGIRSLAWGAMAGIFIGPFLMNAIGAHRSGVVYRPLLDWTNPGLREWIRLSVPLMLGVSLVSFDSWIMNYFASADHGAITLLTYAKNLFTAPVALGQAAGAASLPFLASLATRVQENGEPDLAAFARNVNASVSRILAFSFLLTAWMLGLAFPAVDLIFRGGLFHRNSASEMAAYFAIFSISLCFWSAQTLYARAFYAAGNTLAPMVAGTLVVLVSLPIYWSLYRTHGATGLAIASDIGIAIQTVTLGVMLDRRKMVKLSGLEFPELARSLLATVISYAAICLLRKVMPLSGRWGDLLLLLVATALWAAVAFSVLKVTGSQLPNQVLARIRNKPISA